MRQSHAVSAMQQCPSNGCDLGVFLLLQRQGGNTWIKQEVSNGTDSTIYCTAAFACSDLGSTISRPRQRDDGNGRVRRSHAADQKTELDDRRRSSGIGQNPRRRNPSHLWRKFLHLSVATWVCLRAAPVTTNSFAPFLQLSAARGAERGRDAALPSLPQQQMPQTQPATAGRFRMRAPQT